MFLLHQREIHFTPKLLFKSKLACAEFYMEPRQKPDRPMA